MDCEKGKGYQSALSEDESESLSIFFHRWAQRYGIMDRWGMTWSAAYPPQDERRECAIVGGSSYGYDPNFNDGDW